MFFTCHIISLKMTEFDCNILKHKLITLQNAAENISTFMESLAEGDRRSLAMFSHSLHAFKRDIQHTFQVVQRANEKTTHDSV